MVFLKRDTLTLKLNLDLVSQGWHLKSLVLFSRQMDEVPDNFHSRIIRPRMSYSLVFTLGERSDLWNIGVAACPRQQVVQEEERRRTGRSRPFLHIGALVHSISSRAPKSFQPSAHQDYPFTTCPPKLLWAPVFGGHWVGWTVELWILGKANVVECSRPTLISHIKKLKISVIMCNYKLSYKCR